MTDTSCRIAIFIALTAVAVLASYAVPAQTSSTRPVRIIVGSGAGGFIDVSARIFAAGFSERGQPVVAENIAGAGGQIAAERVARAPADGRTLLVTSPGPVAVIPHFHKTGYDPLKDLSPIALLALTPIGFAVHASVPAQTFPEFVAYAKSRPGKISYAVASQGSFLHLGGELLKSRVGLDMVAVPYRGATPAAAAIFAGDVQAGMADFLSLMSLQQADRTKMRILALAEPARFAFAPDIPTLAESGVAGYEVRGWAMLLAPVRTPKAELDSLNAQAKRTFARIEIRQTLAKSAITSDISDVVETGRFLRAEYDKWEGVSRRVNIDAQ